MVWNIVGFVAVVALLISGAAYIISVRCIIGQTVTVALVMIMALLRTVWMFGDIHSDEHYTDVLIDYSAVCYVQYNEVSDKEYDAIIKQIDEINDEIEESRKYRDTFFLNWFVNHNVGDLELLEKVGDVE